MMKRVLTIISYCMSALALVGLVACTKTPVDPSPDFDPESNTVKAKFVLSVSTNSSSTKMSAATVQADGNGFRGMDKTHLLTYTLKYSGENGERYMYKLDDESSKATRDYDLGALVTAADITKDKNSRTLELAMPLSVNAIMLYGMATKTGSDDEQGASVASGSALHSSLASLSFQLQNRLKDQTALDGFTGMCNLLAMSMTTLTDATLSVHTYGPESKTRDNRYAFWWSDIAGVAPKDDATDEEKAKFPTRNSSGAPLYDESESGKKKLVVDGVEYTYYTGSKSWQKLGEEYSDFVKDPVKNPLSPLGQVMGRAFNELTSIRSKGEGDSKIDELRAGDTASLLRTLQDLSDQIERTVNVAATGWKEEVARQVAKEVQYRLQVFFTWKEGNLQYRSMRDLLDMAKTYFKDYSTKLSQYETALNASSNGDFFPDVNGAGGFPTNLNLPRSAALLACARSDEGNMVFHYMDAIPAYGMGAGSLPVTNYRFPPELIYWANSGIRVSDDATDKLPAIPQTVANWADEKNWSMWTPNGTISSTTRSVALMKQVNYGTALLKSTIKADNPLFDNKDNLFPGEGNEEITVAANSFKVTGILIGGIPDVVGWDFLRKGDNLPEGMTSNHYDKMIYDKLSKEVGVAPDGSDPIYTLVWDSYRPKMDTEQNTVTGIGDENDQASIFVALELVNNTGRDFWGEMNLIRSGGTFYLVGKLDLKKDSVKAQEIEFPDGKFFHYPPFYDDGSTVKVKRVFMQDYMTEAKFQIGQYSLQHAYMTIPDLRSSQISLGLSVDLKWQAGLDFEVLLGDIAD